jgi:hypothetical protein
MITSDKTYITITLMVLLHMSQESLWVQLATNSIYNQVTLAALLVAIMLRDLLGPLIFSSKVGTIFMLTHKTLYI